MRVSDEIWRRRLVVLACALSVFIMSTDMNTVNVALPSLQTHFAVPLPTLQFLVSGYTMALASFYLLSGTLGDRFGRRNVFLGGLALFAVGSVLCATAWTFPVLVGFRVVQAIGAAMLAPMAMAILTDEFSDRRERARAISLWAMAGGLGSGFGPVAGGLLVSGFGWRGIYWASAPFAIAALIIGIVSIKNITSTSRPALNLMAQAFLAVGLCALLIFAVDVGTNGFTVTTAAAAAVLVVAVGALAIVEVRTPTPLIDPQLFHRGAFTGALTAIMAGFFLLGGAFFLTAFFIQSALGLSPLAAGVLMSAWSVGSILAARHLGRSGARRTVGFYYVLFGAIAIVGLGALAVAAALASLAVSIAVVVFGLFAVGAAFSLSNTSTSIFGLESVPPEIMGRAAAFLSVARQVAQALGAALTSVIFAHTAGTGDLDNAAAFLPSYAFVGVVVVALLCLVPLTSGRWFPKTRPPEIA